MTDSKQLFDRCAASCHKASSCFSFVESMAGTEVPAAAFGVIRKLLTESLAGVMKLENLALGYDEPKKGE